MVCWLVQQFLDKSKFFKILLEFHIRVVFLPPRQGRFRIEAPAGTYFKLLISFLFFVRNSVGKRKFSASKQALGDRWRNPKFNGKWRIPKA